jgi:hypothetical protein
MFINLSLTHTTTMFSTLGSRLTNFVGILNQGLRIAPPEAPATGYMVLSITPILCWMFLCMLLLLRSNTKL